MGQVEKPIMQRQVRFECFLSCLLRVVHCRAPLWRRGRLCKRGGLDVLLSVGQPVLDRLHNLRLHTATSPSVAHSNSMRCECEARARTPDASKPGRLPPRQRPRAHGKQPGRVCSPVGPSLARRRGCRRHCMGELPLVRVNRTGRSALVAAPPPTGVQSPARCFPVPCWSWSIPEVTPLVCRRCLGIGPERRLQQPACRNAHIVYAADVVASIPLATTRVKRLSRVEIRSKVDRGWRLEWSERLAPTPAGPSRFRHFGQLPQLCTRDSHETEGTQSPRGRGRSSSAGSRNVERRRPRRLFVSLNRQTLKAELRAGP